MEMVRIFSVKVYHIIIFLFLSKFMSLLPIKKGKIVFSNFQGSGFGDSPAEIAKKLKYYKGLDLVWLVKDLDEPMPKYIRKVKYRSVKACYELGTANAWVDNVRDEHLVLKKKKQVYLQLWHGSFSIKKIEKDASDKLNLRYLLNAIYDGKIIDGITCGNSNQEKIFRRAFYLKNKNQILRYGTPRNDVFYDKNRVDNIRKNVRKMLGIGEKDFVVLYAPTFRNTQNKDVYCVDFESVVDIFERKTHQKVIILIKLHPNIKNIGISYCKELVNKKVALEVSDFSDSVKLGIGADAIITDYSSYIYDFAILGKIGIFFAKDYKDYTKERGLYKKLEEYPFPLATTNEKLIEVINRFDLLKYRRDVKEWLKELKIYETGKSSEKITEWLIGKMSK